MNLFSNKLHSDSNVDGNNTETTTIVILKVYNRYVYVYRKPFVYCSVLIEITILFENHVDDNDRKFL